MFQSTHPHGVRLNPAGTSTGNGQFQSTHPHGVRQKVRDKSRLKLSFNPRTRMGCDPKESQTSTFYVSFNPRTRMGCDFTYDDAHLPHVVSIHAPAWGATSGSGLNGGTLLFQSTHPHGVRQRHAADSWPLRWFQSTHPHGVRHSSR